MHDMPTNTDLARKTKENGRIDSSKFYEDGVMNLTWDGVIPRASQTGKPDDDDDNEEGYSESLAADQEEEDIWQKMASIEDEEADLAHHRDQRRRTSTQS
jgi:hypothetical protein